MRHLWQWFCGYICVCCKGRQVNRFLNLCSRNGIYLWRITYDVESSLRANIRLKDFYYLKPYLRKTKTKIRILSRKGFPFWCYRHPHMKRFLCICAGVLCIGFYSLTYVWKIEVTGNTSVNTEEIIQYLQENQIEVGAKKNEIDCSGIEVLLREEFHQFGWVSVYVQRTNLCIEVKESLYDTVEHYGVEFGSQYDLIANKDATIYSIVTRAGKAVVRKGQSVKQGDLLVLGQNDIYDDSGIVKDTLVFQARAEIWGDVVYDIEIPLTEMEIMSLKIVGKCDDATLLGMGYRKLQWYLQQLEDYNVIILNTEGNLVKKEKNISFRARIYAREQIGINIPVEETLEDEFE